LGLENLTQCLVYPWEEDNSHAHYQWTAPMLRGYLLDLWILPVAQNQEWNRTLGSRGWLGRNLRIDLLSDLLLKASHSFSYLQYWDQGKVHSGWYATGLKAQYFGLPSLQNFSSVEQCGWNRHPPQICRSAYGLGPVPRLVLCDPPVQWLQKWSLPQPGNVRKYI